MTLTQGELPISRFERRLIQCIIDSVWPRCSQHRRCWPSVSLHHHRITSQAVLPRLSVAATIIGFLSL